MPWWHIGEWRYSLTILDLGTRWKCVVSFVPQLLHSWERSPPYPLDMRLGVPQSQSGCCGVQKISCPCQKLNPPAIQPVACCYTDSAIPALTIHNTDHKFALKEILDKYWKYLSRKCKTNNSVSLITDYLLINSDCIYACVSDIAGYVAGLCAYISYVGRPGSMAAISIVF
jgi:hypothetical protein